jgi:uncharacterized protein (DUF433 family)
MQDYVEEREGGYYVAGTRISLDSIVLRFKDGASPESIFRSFPLIGSLERVYGAITFYLANQERVEAYLKQQDELWTEVGKRQAPLPQSLTEKLRMARP